MDCFCLLDVLGQGCVTSLTFLLYVKNGPFANFDGVGSCIFSVSMGLFPILHTM